MKETNPCLSFGPLPAWCGSLRESLSAMAEVLEESVRPWAERGGVFVPEDYGFAAGEKATAAIQRAIDAAGERGGTVRLRAGTYVSGTLVMRSRVRLEVCAGARLLASTDLEDYPEMHARRLTVQDTSMGMHQSLVFAEGCEDIALCGAGVIDGR